VHPLAIRGWTKRADAIAARLRTWLGEETRNEMNV